MRLTLPVLAVCAGALVGGGCTTQVDEEGPVTRPTTSPSAAAPQHSRPPGVPGPPANAQPMRVRYVVDGDTVELQAEQPGAVVGTPAKIPVRLIGVDTPEVHPEPECYGLQASEFLRRLLPENSLVLADRDRDARDDYNRRLLYLWLEDGRFVNYEIVAQGTGEAIRVWPNVEHLDTLRAAQAAAQTADRGLWGSC